MRLTRATNYALRALEVLARGEGGCRSDLRTLARELDAPSAFLGKVLQGLAKAGLVKGCRGVRGGYKLARAAADIDVRSVVEATEGGVELAQCQSSRGSCSRKKNCGASRFWGRLQDRINETLESETVASLSAAGGKPEDRGK